MCSRSEQLYSDTMASAEKLQDNMESLVWEMVPRENGKARALLLAVEEGKACGSTKPLTLCSYALTVTVCSQKGVFGAS